MKIQGKISITLNSPSEGFPLEESLFNCAAFETIYFLYVFRLSLEESVINIIFRRCGYYFERNIFHSCLIKLYCILRHGFLFAFDS